MREVYAALCLVATGCSLVFNLVSLGFLLVVSGSLRWTDEEGERETEKEGGRREARALKRESWSQKHVLSLCYLSLSFPRSLVLASEERGRRSNFSSVSSSHCVCVFSGYVGTRVSFMFSLRVQRWRCTRVRLLLAAWMYASHDMPSKLKPKAAARGLRDD